MGLYTNVDLKLGSTFHFLRVQVSVSSTEHVFLEMRTSLNTMNRGTQYQLSEQYGTKKMILRHSTARMHGEKENDPPTPKLNPTASSFVPSGTQKSKSLGETKNLVEQRSPECVARRIEKMKELGLEPETVKLESRPDTVKQESRALATPSLEQQVQIESMVFLMKKIVTSPEQLRTVVAQMNQV